MGYIDPKLVEGAAALVESFANQRLVFKGRELVDGKRLYESNIFDCATVHLVLRHAPA